MDGSGYSVVNGVTIGRDRHAAAVQEKGARHRALQFQPAGITISFDRSWM